MMSPTFVVLVCLFCRALTAPQPASGAILNGIYDVINNAKQAVVVPAFKVVSDACQTVKKIVIPLDTEKEPDLNKLNVDFVHGDGSKETFSIGTAAEDIPNSEGFNASQKVYLYIHGFNDNLNRSSFGNLSEALLTRGKCNVLGVDASLLIRWQYLRSTEYVRFIGLKLGHVLAALFNNGVDPSRIHILGHSLGAQISGFTGKQFYSLTGRHVGRISGLDPAGPCYTNVGDDMKLNKTDADFVDVIHTDAGIEGLLEDLGDVDFYPNSGSNQPNCGLSSSCSHHRVWQLYTESIYNAEAFPAVKCASWDDFKLGKCSDDISYMGFPAKKGATGRYYLQTAGTSPYSLGMKGIQYQTS